MINPNSGLWWEAYYAAHPPAQNSERFEMAEPLKTYDQVIRIVEHSELERFVHDMYSNSSYSYIVTEDSQEGDLYEVDGIYRVNDDEEDVALIKKGIVPKWRNQLLLDVLCEDGLITPGIYLVQVNL